MSKTIRSIQQCYRSLVKHWDVVGLLQIAIFSRQISYLCRQWTQFCQGSFHQKRDILHLSLFSSSDQIRLDYLIGLESNDIGDYSPPSEQIYSNIFNTTGLETLVQIRYIPRSINDVLPNDGQISFFPFGSRSDGHIYGVTAIVNISFISMLILFFFQLDWWVILLIIIAILATWLILCLLCYVCFRKR